MFSYSISHDSAEKQKVRLIALLHDVGDWKLTGSDDAACMQAKSICLACGASEDLAEEVGGLVDRVSYSKSLSGSEAETTPIELACVQDADRMDAIGAIGIARTFAYGGSKGRSLYDPASYPPRKVTDVVSKADYRGSEEPTINHFYDKLLRLAPRMKTQVGLQMAKARFAYSCKI